MPKDGVNVYFTITDNGSAALASIKKKRCPVQSSVKDTSQQRSATMNGHINTERNARPMTIKNAFIVESILMYLTSQLL